MAIFRVLCFAALSDFGSWLPCQWRTIDVCQRWSLSACLVITKVVAQQNPSYNTCCGLHLRQRPEPPDSESKCTSAWYWDPMEKHVCHHHDALPLSRRSAPFPPQLTSGCLNLFSLISSQRKSRWVCKLPLFIHAPRNANTQCAIKSEDAAMWQQIEWQARVMPTGHKGACSTLLHR